MTIGGLATTIKTLLVRRSGVRTTKAVVGRCMSQVARLHECHDNENELQSFKHIIQGQDKVYGEREESCWIPDPRTGIYYPKGHEVVMKDIPNSAARFAYSYWLRNSDSHGV